MGRQRRDFKRTSGVRDAALFVIATEGEKTEKAYIEELIGEDNYYSSRVHVEVLATSGGVNSPSTVLSRLDSFKKEYKLRSGDELWIMIDRDKKTWKVNELSQVRTLCGQKNYGFGLTNPCFEFWVLMHLEKPDYDESTITQLLENNKTGSRTYCEIRILNKLKSYSKSKPDFKPVLPHVRLAIERNLKLTNEHKVDIFDHLGTTIDILIKKLIETPQNTV